MDRKQREDAINEVSSPLSFIHTFCSKGPRAQSNAAPLHHHVQRIVYGQEVSVHRHGLR